MFDALESYLDSKADEQAESSNALYPLSPTTNNVMEKFYKNLEKLGYNLDELKPALEQSGTSLIISCAGSGKTTFLELKLIHDYLSGELFEDKPLNTADGVRMQKVLSRVFISTFLKTGAEELKNSFDEKCTELCVQGICADSLTFSTLHAEYYAILHELGVKLKIMSDEDANAALARACKALSIRSRSKTYGSLGKDELADIACIVTYARNRIDADRYKHPLAEEYGITPAILDKLIELFHGYRKAEDAYDFEDLQELIYQGITTNPAFAQMIASRYKYIFIDEFQDTSQIQYQVLKTYISGAQKTIAIGDDDQCIYSWRGSDVNIITKSFREDYNPAIHKFTVNFRCRAGILAPVVSSIKRNKNRYDKDLTAFKSGGLVVRRNTSNVNDLMIEINDALANQYSVGVLSRTNFDLLAPAILLELADSVPFSLSKSVGINSYIPRQVFGCLKLLTRRYTEEFEGLLKAFCGRYREREARTITDILNNQPEMRLSLFKDEDLAYSCPDLYANFFKPVRSAADPVSAYITLLKYLSNNYYTGDSPFALRGRLFISFVIDLICNHSKLKGLPVEDLDELFTDVIPSRLSKRAYSKSGSSARVRLTTVHEAKGKEWQAVVIWNDINGVFPAQVGRHQITEAEFEEERRLHYIAFTRARERLTVFTSETNPSPFLLECDFDAKMTAVVEGAPSEERKTLTTKTGIPVEDKFRSTLAEMMVTTDTDINVKTLNLLAYFQYDQERVLTEIRRMYGVLQNSGQLSGAGGDFGIEFRWCVECLLIEIMSKTAAQA